MTEITQIVKEKLIGKKILITGGLGMIGSNIAHKLVYCGSDVTIVDAMIEPYGANMFNINGIRNKLKLYDSDIRDSEAMKLMVKDKDFIFNLAGQVSHNDSITNPMLDADINYIGHLNVLESIRKFNPLAKIIYSGSRLQYGKLNYCPVDETHPMNPRTPYGFNKMAAEYMYEYYYDNHNISFVSFRIANPYGIRCQMKHSKYSIINYFIKLAMQGKEISIFGDGRQLRDYINVDDLANALILACIKNNTNGKKYNLGTGIGTKFIDMVKLIIDIVSNGKFTLVPWPDDYLDVETGDYITNISNVKNDLGWVPRITLKSGIEKTVKYYKKYGKYYY